MIAVIPSSAGGFLLVVACLYFVPTIIAGVRKVPNFGSRMREHLRILVCRYDDLCQKVEPDWKASKPFRARAAKRDGIHKYKV